MTQTLPNEPKAPSDAMARSRRALSGVLRIGVRLAALVVIFCAFGIMIPGGGFFSPDNIETILVQSSVYAMCGLGMTMIIITGGIDLAAGSTIAMSMVLTAMILKGGVSGEGAGLAAHPVLTTLLAVIGGICVGALVGMIQGSLITGQRLVPFIVTLGGFTTVRGLAKGISGDQEIHPPRNWLFQHLMRRVQGRRADLWPFRLLPTFRVHGLIFNWELFAAGIWLTIIMAIFAAAMLRYTKFGRRVYAVGSNESTARLCGVPVNKTKILVYALAGAFTGLAGVMEFSRLGIGQPTGAMSYELYVIAACVIGGTSLQGGVGAISGTIIGALIIGTLYSGAQQAEWPKWVQEAVIGAIIVEAVALDQLRDRSRRKS